MPTLVEVPETTQHTATPRFYLSDDLKKNATGAVKLVLEGLGVAASMTQNVPYLGIISGVLTEFMKIQDEVNAFESDWKSVIANAGQIKSIIDASHEACKDAEDSDKSLPQDFVNALTALEKCIMKALETLNACKVGLKGFMGGIRKIMKRGDLAESVKQCSRDMDVALNHFNTRVIIGTRFAVHLLHDKVPTPAAAAPIMSSAKIPPPPPGIFFGRARELEHILDLVLHKAPARVAILGSGGIGKTSIALAALHNAAVETMYKSLRVFVPCEAIFTAEGVVHKALKFFGIAYEPQRTRSPQDVLLSHLQRQTSDMLLCLDNFETPWDADGRAVESLLSSLASLPRLTLLITTRGSNRPMGVVWTQPFLQPISPLTREASLQTWDAICGSDQRDEHTIKLIEAVDCVPLAVTLLANLAQTETPEALWERWELEHTNVLQSYGSGDHLSSIEASIELSINGPRLKGKDSVVQLLSVICILPQGVLESRISVFTKAFLDSIPNLRGSIALLKQCALVQPPEDGFIRSLSPVVHYMRSRYPVSPHVYAQLAATYFDLVKFSSTDSSSMITYAQSHVQREVENITAVFRRCLGLESELLVQTLQAVSKFTHLCRHYQLRGISLLDRVIESAKDDDTKTTLLIEKGDNLYLSAHFVDAIRVYAQAREICRSGGAPVREGWCLSKLGETYYWHGQYNEAKDVLNLSLSLYQGQGELHREAYSRLYLGLVLIALGLLSEAESVLQTLHEDQIGAAAIFWALGNLHIASYQFVEAEDELSHAYELSKGALLNQANCLQSLGHLYILQSSFETAEGKLQSAMDIYSQIGNRRGVADCLGRLGQLYTQLHEFTKAETYLLSSDELHVEVGHPLGRVTTLNSLGALHHILRRYDDAHEALQSALEISSGMPYPIGRGDALLYLGKVARDCGRHQEATAHFRDALGLFEQAQDPRRTSSAQAEIDGIGGGL